MGAGEIAAIVVCALVAALAAVLLYRGSKAPQPKPKHPRPDLPPAPPKPERYTPKTPPKPWL